MYFVIKVFKDNFLKNLIQKHFIGKEKRGLLFKVLDFLNCHSLESRLAKTCSPSVGAFSNTDAFSNTLQYFYHTSVSSAIAIKLLNWCVSGASPVQDTVLWNISFEVLMYPLSINLPGAKEEQGEVSRGGDACAGCPTGFASWEVPPTLFYLCWTIFKSQRCGQSCVSFFVAVEQQAPGLHLLHSVGNTGCSPLVWWFSFHPRKVSLAPLCCISLSGLSLLSWEQVGHLADRLEGRNTLSCLQCLLPAGAGSQPWGRGCRTEPLSLPWTDLIFQSHLPRCPWALT